MSFSRDTKTVLAHCTRIAETVAKELDDNGFVDGPHNVRKLLPINTQERIEAMMVLLSSLRAKLFDRSNGARGMTQGEIVCLSYVSELFGVMEGTFKLPTIELAETDTLFPVEVSDGRRKIELD